MYQSHPVPKNSTEYSVSKKLKFLYPQSNIPVKIFNNPSHKLSTNFPQTFLPTYSWSTVPSLLSRKPKVTIIIMIA